MLMTLSMHKKRISFPWKGVFSRSEMPLFYREKDVISMSEIPLIYSERSKNVIKLPSKRSGFQLLEVWYAPTYDGTDTTRRVAFFVKMHIVYYNK